MTAITTITLTSPNTLASAPVAVGQGFKKGDIPSGMYLTTDQPNLSCIPLATWNDGSLKHARIVGSVPTTANVPLVIHLLSTNVASAGANLTSASITAANPSASVQCGALGTVTLSSLLGHEIRTVASTPQMVECHYRAQIPGTLLSVWFYVSLWANGAVKIRAAVENGYLDNGSGAVAANVDYNYVPTVIIGGVTVLNTPTVNIANVTVATQASYQGTQYQETITTAVPHGLSGGVYLANVGGMTADMNGARFATITDAYTLQTDWHLTSYGSFTSGGTATFLHHKNTRWYASGWIGSDPQVIPAHDTAYLRASKLVPNYSLSTATSAQLDGLVQTYAPLSHGGIPAYMPDGGGNPIIALLPMWDAAYVGTADPRAFKAVLAGSDALNSYPIVWRDANTKDTIKPSSFPTWSIYGPSASNSRGPEMSKGGLTWEINHHPGLGYTAYLLTGDYWHYETLQLNMATAWVCRGIMSIDDATHGVGTSRIPAHETRGGAWSARTMSILCGIMPDSEKVAGKVGAEYRELLANNVAYWKSLVDKPGINALGMLYEFSPGGVLSGYGPNNGSAWQQAWWVQSDGFGSDLEPLSDMTNYIAVRNFRYKAIVGLLGDVNTGFPYDSVTVYVMKISSGTNPDPTTWYQDWRSAAIATFAPANDGAGINSIPHTNKLLNVGDFGANGYDGTIIPFVGGAGAPEDAFEGRWGYMLPAIAYAVDHGAPGAAESWARVSGSSNYSALTGAFTNQSSQWGVFPRNETVIGVVPMTHAVGPAIRLGRMRTGRITVSKYHGNGIPASAIAMTGTDGPGLLANDIDANDPVGTVYRLDMLDVLPAGAQLNEDSSLMLPAQSDGTHNYGERVFKNGTAAYDTTLSATFGQAGVVTPTVTLVTVSPLTQALNGGATQQFAAAVVGTNSPGQGVTWSVTGGGSISATGLLTAPTATSTSQTLTVRATSTVDPTKSGTATVTVAAAVVTPPSTPTVTSVTVSPATANVAGGGTCQMSASVVGTNNPGQGVNWSVAGGGSINSTGLFTAPAATTVDQSVTITARSTVDSSKTGTATITVPALAIITPVVTGVVVSPSSVSLNGAHVQQFSVAVNGSNVSQAVTWSVVSGAGTITSTGLFTGPVPTTVDQQLVVRATSVQDPSKYVDVAITIAAILVDAPLTDDTTLVLLHIITPDGQPVVGATVEIQLQHAAYTDTINAIYMPRLVTLTTDSQGKASAHLMPCDTPYYVTVTDSASDMVLAYKAIVPLMPEGQSVRLQDIVTPI